MLQADPAMRISIQSLVEEIHHVSSDPGISVVFAGLCCNEEYDLAETVATSVYQASIMSSRTNTIVSKTRPSTPMRALGTSNPYYHRPLSHPVTPEITFDPWDRRFNSSPASDSSKTTVIASRTGINPFRVNEGPRLNFPDESDQRTVNEILREWLSGFAEDTFWSFTILTGFEQHPGYLLLHKLGDGNKRFYQAMITLWRRLFINYETANQEFVRNIISIMDRMNIPYIVHNLGFTCFYPDGILSGFDEDNSIEKDGSIEVNGLQALRLLDESRPKVLEWWYDCLTAPRQMWYEKLKSTRVICIQLTQFELYQYTVRRVDCQEDRSSVETSELHRESLIERKKSGTKLCVGASFEHLCQQSENPLIRAFVPKFPTSAETPTATSTP